MAVTRGVIADVQFAGIQIQEYIGGKRIVDDNRTYCRVVLDNGRTFTVTAKTGRILRSHVGDKVKVTQEDGLVRFEI
jgi:hypothetical protein